MSHQRLRKSVSFAPDCQVATIPTDQLSWLPGEYPHDPSDYEVANSRRLAEITLEQASEQESRVFTKASPPRRQANVITRRSTSSIPRRTPVKRTGSPFSFEEIDPFDKASVTMTRSQTQPIIRSANQNTEYFAARGESSEFARLNRTATTWSESNIAHGSRRRLLADAAVKGVRDVGKSLKSTMRELRKGKDV